MVTRYAFDASGRLELLDSVATRGHWPRSFDVSPDGDLLLVANERADEVVLVSSQEPDSEIVGRIASARVLQPSCVVFG
jgi:6-phosphogluconolactonase